MITIDCPLCDGPAATDGALTVVACEDCGIAVDVAPDPTVTVRPLDAAA